MLHTGLSLALTCMAFVACSGVPGERHPDADAWTSMGHPPGTRHLGEEASTSSSYWQIAHLDGVFLRSIGLGDRGFSQNQRRHLHVEDREKSPESGTDHVTHRRIESPLILDMVWARGSHELWVHGQRGDGVDVIERWEIRKQLGAYVSERWSAGPRIGHPLALVRPPVTSIVGGTFLEPELREGDLTFERTLMYEADPGNRIVSFDIDMDGRYLLVIDDDYGIRQVLTDGMSNSRRLPGSSTFPTGPLRIDEVSISCDLNLGRILKVYAGGEDFIGMYVDGDNDGVFESLQVLNHKTHGAIRFDGLMHGEY